MVSAKDGVSAESKAEQDKGACAQRRRETAADAQNRAYLRSYCGYLWRFSGYLRIPARLFVELRGRRVRGARRPGPNSPKLSCARLARCIAARRARTCTTPCVRARASLCAWLRLCHISLRARARVCARLHLLHTRTTRAGAGKGKPKPKPSRAPPATAKALGGLGPPQQYGQESLENTVNSTAGPFPCACECGCGCERAGACVRASVRVCLRVRACVCERVCTREVFGRILHL